MVNKLSQVLDYLSNIKERELEVQDLNNKLDILDELRIMRDYINAHEYYLIESIKKIEHGKKEI